jgi:hypothetical protein
VLSGQLQPLAAGHQQIQSRASGEDGGNLTGRLDELLEVVQENQGAPIGHVLDEPFFRAKRMRGRLDD